jgi:hypothetical protein
VRLEAIGTGAFRHEGRLFLRPEGSQRKIVSILF